MTVSKKRTFASKKCIRKNFWNNFSLAKSLSTGNSRSFFLLQTNRTSKKT